MSIVALKKVVFYGHVDSKAQALDDLQALGCLHLIPLTDEGEPAGDGSGPSRQSRDALQFLASCPNRRRQVSDPTRFDAVAVEREALALQKKLFDLHEERDYFASRLKNLEPWGDFQFAPLEEVGGQRFWFYIIPRRELGGLAQIEQPWHIVNSDERFAYVVVLSEDEPTEVPFERTLAGWRSPADLRALLEEAEHDIEDTEAARGSLTRWCDAFARSLDGLEDRAARQMAARQTFDQGPLYALQAWAPADRLSELENYAIQRGLALEVTDPVPDDQPPTLFHNPPALRAGEDLVTFYTTPGYRLWDPSSVVFYSFAIFFAMIISDAGYGLVIGGVTAWLWNRLGATDKGRQWRVLLATLTGATVLYGALVGSYFGFTPPDGSLLDALHLIDMADSGSMMAIAIFIGASHVILATSMDAYRQRGSPAGLAPLGWSILVTGGLSLGARLVFETLPAWPGQAAMVVGVVLVLVYSGYGAGAVQRAVQGVLALTRLTKAFGDVLSYLRLFALGLASASLAVAFNGMAADVREAVPGIGLFLGLLVFGLGHALNFILAIASGVIHGLRLNMIEFFDWGVTEEGNLFRAFRRKGSE